MRKVVPLRSLLIQHHLILDSNDIHLIDSGFIGGIPRIEKALSQLGKKLSDVRSIILSHGHLDHSLNVARLQSLTQCKVYAPKRDRDHLSGQHRYTGWSKTCGWLEQIGRILLPFQIPKVDQWFDDGDLICGLTVVALPGHTIGHCGFLLAEEKLLLAGDLFSHHFDKACLPPRVFNDNHEEAQRSVKKAAPLDLTGVFLNHGCRGTPKDKLLALIHLADDL